MARIKYGLQELRFISDPGHGWLEVPTADVEAAGYAPSRYSYNSNPAVMESPGAFTYLEEDCDVAGYMGAIGVSLSDLVDYLDGVTYPVRTDYSSFIRELPRCSGEGFVSPFARRSN